SQTKSMFFDIMPGAPKPVDMTSWATEVQHQRFARDKIDDPYASCLPQVFRACISTIPLRFSGRSAGGSRAPASRSGRTRASARRARAPAGRGSRTQPDQLQDIAEEWSVARSVEAFFDDAIRRSKDWDAEHLAGLELHDVA